MKVQEKVTMKDVAFLFCFGDGEEHSYGTFGKSRDRTRHEAAYAAIHRIIFFSHPIGGEEGPGYCKPNDQVRSSHQNLLNG